jgi:two-component system sensor histidine kinase RpfC
MRPVQLPSAHATLPTSTNSRWRAKFIAAPKAELEQSLLRVAIPAAAILVLVALGLWKGSLDYGQQRGLAIAIAFLVFAASITGHIVLKGEHTNVKARRVLGIFADNAVNTYFMFVMGEGGAIVFGVYLFVTFGNGFRYGRWYLHLSQAFSLCGFLCVLVFSPFWSQHPAIGVGMLIALFVLPFYVGVLAQRITEAKLRADEANRAKDRFLANVSHEMRTPLNGVIAMADMLRETSLSSQQADMVDTLSTSAQMALKQVEDVLSAAKFEAGRTRAVEAPFDLIQLVRDTSKVVLPQAGYKGLSVTVDTGARAAAWFNGDAGHLQQVMLNLLSNAVKFTEKGAVALRAVIPDNVAAEGDSVVVRIEVQDTGIGIPKDKLAAIFEPFAQADDSITRNYGGTGLGTTIARQLTTLLGGSIGVESTPGIGSLFWVEIPLRPCEAIAGLDGSQTLRKDPIDLPATALVRGARVLVADDNETNQRVTELILRSRGHIPTVVSNGDEALDALEAYDFDIALFDLSMPVLSGLDALKAHRFISENPIPVIILSANVTSPLVEACKAAGAADFVAKPVRASLLLDAIERQLAGKPITATSLDTLPTVRDTGGLPWNASESSAIDEKVLSELSQMSSDPTFVSRLLRGFREDCEKCIPRVLAALESGNIEVARDAAHALKGGAGGVGAIALMRVAAKLERQLASQESIGDFVDLRREITDCADRTFDAIDARLGSSKSVKHRGEVTSSTRAGANNPLADLPN